MKVIGFIGSPRTGGNTSILVEKVLEEAKNTGADVEAINLTDLIIGGCRGCRYCKSHDKCRLDDAMQDLYGKIAEADRFVLGTPVYFAQMTGHFKQFLDRWYALIDANYQSRIPPGKKASLIITQGDPDITKFRSISSTFEFGLTFLGVELKETLIVGELDNPKDVLQNPKALEKAAKLGSELVR